MKDNSYDYAKELIDLYKSIKYSLNKHCKTMSPDNIAIVHNQLYEMKKNLMRTIEAF